MRCGTRAEIGRMTLVSIKNDKKNIANDLLNDFLD